MIEAGPSAMVASLSGLIWVALGSAIGGSARYFLSGVVGRRIGETFPWGTMVVNVTGSFALGVIAAASPQPTGAWQFVAVGILGSYTTVSSFSLQTLMLARDGQFLRAGANIVLSLVLCLSAVTLGFAAVAPMAGRP